MLRNWLSPDADLAERRSEALGWGVGDAVLALLVGQVVAIVGSLVIFVVLGYDTPDEISDAPLWVLLLTQIPLWLGYVGTALWITNRKGRGPVVDLGWRGRWSDLAPGLAVGVALQLVAVPLLYVLIFLVFPEGDVSESAQELADRATDATSAVMLVLITVVGAPIVEELFFRGLVLRAFESRYGSTAGIFISALIFGAVHVQLLQLPALVMFGLVAGWLTVRSGRLGPAIWAHVGFNGITVLFLLAGS